MQLTLSDFAKNHLFFETDDAGFVRFDRFMAPQRALHAGVPFSARMANASAGVELAFTTTGDRVAFECRQDHRLATRLPAIWKWLKQRSFRRPREGEPHPLAPYDGFDCVVDGELAAFAPPLQGRMEFRFHNPGARPVAVRIVFPTLLSVRVRNLEVSGHVSAQEAPRERILCLGDSITQGMMATHPSANYVSKLSQALGVEVLNQGIVGLVHGADSLRGLEALPPPKLVTVAYGTNDWSGISELDEIRRNVEAYYAKLTSLWPGVPLKAITPVWRQDAEDGAPCGGLRDVAACIASVCTKHPKVAVIDGFELIPHDPSYYWDGVHPNAKGFAVMAERLAPQLVA